MLLIFSASAALAADYTDRASWEAGTGDVTAIGFTEYAEGARVTTQYAGLSFTTWVTIEDGSGFTSDGRMLGAGGPIEIDLGAAWHGVAIELPTQATIELYDASDNLVYASPVFGGSFSSTPYFGGVTTSDAFSKIVIFDPDTPSATYIDNLYLSEAPAAPPPGPQLTIGGSCPGTATLSWSQLTPFATVALVHGPGAGSTTIPGGACAGTVVDVGAASVMRFLTADASGAASLTVTAQPWHCGALYQTIDMSTCDVSGVASF